MERLNLRPGLLALLYGRIHRSVKKFCRDPPTAPRAPHMPHWHTVHPAAPGTSALAAGKHCTKTRLRSRLYLIRTCRDLLEGIETLTSFWYRNNIWPRKRPGRTFKNLSLAFKSEPSASRDAGGPAAGRLPAGGRLSFYRGVLLRVP